MATVGGVQRQRHAASRPLLGLSMRLLAVSARENVGNAPHPEARQVRHRCGASLTRRLWLPLTGCIEQTMLVTAATLPLLCWSNAVRELVAAEWFEWLCRCRWDPFPDRMHGVDRQLGLLDTARNAPEAVPRLFAQSDRTLRESMLARGMQLQEIAVSRVLTDQSYGHRPCLLGGHPVSCCSPKTLA